MKHAPPESIKQRVIPPNVIAEVTKELEDLEGEVKAVQREEKEEKEVRLVSPFRLFSLLPICDADASAMLPLLHSTVEVIWN